MPTSFHFADLRTPAIMGIVNVTPNSFSDTGKHLAPNAAMAHLQSLVADGAQILDLGAEASSFFRPGVGPVDADEQLCRLVPLLAQLSHDRPFYISIDTRSAAVARRALHDGADIINDISAGTHDAEMLPLVAKTRASIILMHIGPSFPENPRQNDPDILATVRTYLADRVAAARLVGIPQNKIAIDPGLGFGKTPHDNWLLALRAHELQSALQLPLVLGASRKRFLEAPPPAHLIPPTEWRSLLEKYSPLVQTHPRDPATAALAHVAMQRGIAIHRLHNLRIQ